MKVIDRFDRIERTRDELLEQAPAMSPHELTWRSQEGKWSILEILDHLVAAEEACRRPYDRRPDALHAGGRRGSAPETKRGGPAAAPRAQLASEARR